MRSAFPTPRLVPAPSVLRLLALLFAPVLAIVVAGCGDDLVQAGTAGGAILPFNPRAPLVVDVDGALAADSAVELTSPHDRERVELRPYPAQCFGSGRGPACDVVAFVSRDSGINRLFFEGNAGVWHATAVVGENARRGLLYVPAGTGAAVRDAISDFVDVATMTEVRCGSRCSPAGAGARLRLHAVLPTSDALRPGMSLVWQPPRVGDGVLHVAAGEEVSVGLPGGERLQGRAGSPSQSAPPAVPQPWAITDSRVYTLSVPDSEHIGVTIRFRLTNHSGVTLFTREECSGFAYLERWSGREWQSAYGFGCLDGAGYPGRIAADTTVGGHVDALHDPVIPSWPAFMVDPIPGTYRIGFALYRRAVQDGGRTVVSDSLPPGTALSNTFTIEAP